MKTKSKRKLKKGSIEESRITEMEAAKNNEKNNEENKYEETLNKKGYKLKPQKNSPEHSDEETLAKKQSIQKKHTPLEDHGLNEDHYKKKPTLYDKAKFMKEIEKLVINQDTACFCNSYIDICHIFSVDDIISIINSLLISENIFLIGFVLENNPYNKPFSRDDLKDEQKYLNLTKTNFLYQKEIEELYDKATNCTKIRKILHNHLYNLKIYKLTYEQYCNDINLEFEQEDSQNPIENDKK